MLSWIFQITMIGRFSFRIPKTVTRKKMTIKHISNKVFYKPFKEVFNYACLLIDITNNSLTIVFLIKLRNTPIEIA